MPGKDRYFCCLAHANLWQQRSRTSHVCKVCCQPFTRTSTDSKRRAVIYCSQTCCKADPDQLAKLRQINAAQRNRLPNRFEAACYAMLTAAGISHEKQFLFGGRFCLDAYLPTEQIAIEFDGDYWHGNPARYPAPNALQIRQRQMDANRQKYLSKSGVLLVRFWQSDFQKSAPTILTQIQNAIEQRHSALRI